MPDPDETSGVPSDDPATLGRRLPMGPAAAMFLFIGAFVGVMTAIYWFTSYEDAGSVMLLLAAAMAVWFGTFLWLQQRQAVGAEEPATASSTSAEYLPHASVWPFVMALGAATLVNGLVLGIWIVVPGVVALALGVGGFIRQSRHRD